MGAVVRPIEVEAPVAAAIKPVRRRRIEPGIVALQLLVLIAVLAFWQFGAEYGIIRKFFFSQPTEVVQRLGDWFIRNRTIYRHIEATFIETVLSFVIGVVLGIIFGFIMARSELAAKVFGPYVTMLNAMPRVVLAPIFVLWFGLGQNSKVALGVSLVFFIVFYNTFQGVREADPRVIDKARMLGASNWQVIRYVQFPSAVTWILSSLHTSVGFALAGVVVGEYLGSTKGIGYLVSFAEGNFDSTGVFAGMTVLAALVMVIELSIIPVERRLLRWQPKRESGTHAREV
ncbi:MAG: ABC transporter permease [Thermomicrobia bacterium]|nr:ABC transporter permease [Thermomicrobia bacterium]